MTEQKPANSAAPLLLLFGGLAVVLMALVTPMAGRRQVSPTATPVVPTLTAAPTTVAQISYDPITVSAGESLFQSTCAACHGFNAQGVPGLGKTLIGSEFVNGLTDAEFVAFLEHGRDITDPLNTTGMMMPAKGGNPALSETNLQEIVAYIRTINLDAPVVVEAGAVPAEAAVEPAGVVANATPVAVGVPAVIDGELNLSAMPPDETYLWSCAGCHGVDGAGVANVGPGLAGSALLDSANGIALFDFLVEGRPFADPRVMYPHPARGVYPALTNEQLRSLIAYVYTLSLGS